MGGSLQGAIHAVDAILALTDSDTKIIPGHGPLANKLQLQAYREMLDTVYHRLLALRNKGVSAQDAVAQAPLSDLEAQWGGGIFTADKWIPVIYPAIY